LFLLDNATTKKRQMTERQRLELHEERLRIYARDRGICQACGEPVGVNEFQVAHRISNSVANRKRCGDEVIDHPLNKATTHSGRCNDFVNCGFKPDKCLEIVEAIEACYTDRDNTC